jgi:GrpB-like predicted nucleotidyltransferase (UPF0157 family)
VTIEPVHIVAYDPSWPTLFAQERNLILQAVGQWIEEVEHVGSTAIPGLDAKPVVDLVVGLKYMSDALLGRTPQEPWVLVLGRGCQGAPPSVR